MICSARAFQLLALSDIRETAACPLSGVKRTSLPHRKMSANDPKRTSVGRMRLFASTLLVSRIVTVILRCSIL